MSSRMKFSNRNLDALKPPASGQAIYWDEGQRGFGLRMTPGGVKSFIAEGRVNGNTCRVTIGRYPEFTADKARGLAMAALAHMSQGIDPNQQKTAAKVKGRTLGDVLEEYLSKKQLRDTTRTLYRKSFDLCFADWKNKAVSDITKDEVERRFKQLGTGWRAKKTEHSRGDGEALASQGMRLLGSLFNFEIRMYDVIMVNPVQRLSLTNRGWSKAKQRQGVIHDSQMPLFYEGIMGLKNDTARDYLMLVALTGLRAQEAAGLRWGEVDLREKYILLPAERTKNKVQHALPLPPYLCKLLARRHAANEARRVRSDFVFPGPGKSGHYTEPKMAAAYVSEHMKKRFTPHDLRRTFATVSQKLEIHSRIQSRLLNHSKQSDITERYIQVDIDQLRPAMNHINDYILKAMKAPHSVANAVAVLPPRRAGRQR